MPILSKRYSPLKNTCIGIGTLGIGMAGISLGRFFAGNVIGSYAIAGLSMFTILMSASLLNGVIGVQFMKTVDIEYMSRASAVFNASATAAMPIGAFLVSIAVSHVPTAIIILFSAVFTGVVLLVTALTRPVLEKKEEIPYAT